MKAVFVLPAIPAAAALAGLIFLVGIRIRRLRWVALAWCALSLPTLAILAYRLRDHFVGPDTFTWWRFDLSPSNMSFILPMAVISPLLLLASEGRSMSGGREAASSALAAFGIAASLAAVMSDHLLLLSGLLALATWCLAGAVMLRGKLAGRILPFLFPLGLADLCFVLGVLFLYLSDPSRGLSFPANPLQPGGRLAVSCALMLAAALLRLGAFPLQRWMAGVSGGGKDIRIVHLLAVNLTLGAFTLFMVMRNFYRWDGVWIWICFGVAAVSLLELMRELFYVRAGREAWGLLCAAFAAALALAASPGGQAATAALRLGLWAGVPALALVELGSGGDKRMDWARVVGGISLLGLPPLAGFAWLWMGTRALTGEFSGGISVLFPAAIPVILAGAMLSGTVALLLPREGEGDAPVALMGVAGVFLAGFTAAVGLYPGAMVDLLMREYGLPVGMPFDSWTSLAWAALLCVGLAILVVSVRTLRKPARVHVAEAGKALPLVVAKRYTPFLSLPGNRSRAAVVLCQSLMFVGWIAAMVYLAIK